MDIALYYYTGTGNSLWISRMLAETFGDRDRGRVSISRISSGTRESQSDAMGIVFPVHIWGVPHPIVSFIDSLKNDSSRYYFAVAVHAGQVAATLLQFRKLMHAKGLTLSAGFEIAMPSNYIPWGGPGPKDKQVLRFTKAREKVKTISEVVAKRGQRPVERGPLWQNILFAWLNRLSFPRVPSMDKSFWVDEKCNFCGVCKTICPCGNIGLQAGRPVWSHHCEQCFACIQWCPSEAIQFGKKTPRYARYRHPEVKLSDMVEGRK